MFSEISLTEISMASVPRAIIVCATTTRYSQCILLTRKSFKIEISDSNINVSIN
jgi:hypothetical protein